MYAKGVSRMVRRLSTMTDQAASDFSFLMSLLERPRERRSMMTPERWPDIMVRSQVMVVSSRLDGTSISQKSDHARTLDAWDWPSELSGLDRQPPSSSSPPTTPSPTPLPSAKQQEHGPSLDRVVQTRLVSPSTLTASEGDDRGESSISRIKTILGLLSDLSIEHQRPIQPREKYVALVDSITFREPGTKSLVSVLSKAFDFDGDNVPGNLPFVHSKHLAPERPASPPEVPSVEPSVGEKREAGPKVKNISRVLVLAGEDLHLVRYGQLQRLAALYGLEHRNKSRRLLEKSLCKFLAHQEKDRGRDEIDRIAILTVAGGPIVPISRPKGDKSADGKFVWEDANSLKLMQRAGTVLAARSEIVKCVEDYLVQNGSNPTGPEDAEVESLCMWEVVAAEFPGASPKACQKRWMLLHRLECMEKLSEP